MHALVQYKLYQLLIRDIGLHSPPPPFLTKEQSSPGKEGDSTLTQKPSAIIRIIRNATKIKGKSRFPLERDKKRPCFSSDVTGTEEDTMPQDSNSNAMSTRRFHTTSSLYIESVRLATFVGWPSSHILTPDQLARAGFFYLRSEDHTQCSFCKGIVGYWEAGDDPELEHQRLFPACPLASGKPTGNVPLIDSGRDEEEDEEDLGEDVVLDTLIQASQTHVVPHESSPEREMIRKRQRRKLERKMWRLLQTHYDHLLACTRPRPPKPSGANLLEWKERIANPRGRVAVPTLNTTEARLKTFASWRQCEVGVEVKALVQAGFYWTGVGDLVQCFHCHGGIMGWREGEDPIDLHARLYPTCPFALSERGKKFGRQCQEQLSSSPLQHRGLRFDESPFVAEEDLWRLRGVRTHRLKEEEARLLLLHPMAQDLLTLGLPRDSILLAFRLRMELGGGVLFRDTGEALMEAFSIWETLHNRRIYVANPPQSPPDNMIRRVPDGKWYR
ncbi:inhibitor of apoptosis protein-like [Oratosquilla oratoria]|uniref:inhibitor of apoptosis protein-like n=1 Tax=Oratosquilla oratoria TaxID=337810 RepID=UPI003F75BF9E